MGGGADRLWHAARIYHAGKAPWVIVSGGQLPWLSKRRSEAEGGQTWVYCATLSWWRTAARIRENAVFTAELLRRRGIDRALLVTSALNMPRSLANFRAAGIDAEPGATDFEVMPGPNHILRWLPDAPFWPTAPVH